MKNFYCQIKESSQSIYISFKTNNGLSFSMMEELETLIQVLTPQIKASTIYFEGNIPENFDFYHQVKSAELIHEFYQKYQKILLAIKFLPQTTICDWEKSASGLCIDFGLSCDLALIEQNGFIHFNHLHIDLSPCYTTTSLISDKIGLSLATKCILAAKKFNSSMGLQYNLIYEDYSKENKISKRKKINENINKQNSIHRIQAKRSLLECFIVDLGIKKKELDKIAKASVFYNLNQDISHFN